MKMGSKGEACKICRDSKDKRKDGWIQCDFCTQWHHGSCVGFTAPNKLINWYCNDCKKEIQELRQKLIECEEERDKLQMQLLNIDKISDNVVKLNDAVKVLREVAVSQPVANTRPSYADTLKAKKKEKKNLLIIESKDPSQAVNAEMQSQLVDTLGNIQVIDTRENNKKIIMNFENEEIRNEAVQKINECNSIKVTPVKKYDPKIMLLDVYGCENQDNLLDTICERNSFLNGKKDKMQLILRKPSRYNEGYFNYLLKCDPEIRKAIHMNDDKVCIGFGKYDVVDNYHITVCYHCQHRGHLAKNCPDKEKDKLCPKCAGNHGIKECNVPADQRKCFSCSADNRDDVCHMANTRACPKFVAELNKIKARTDHGF